MKANPHAGTFIALEGIDASGHTTQQKMLGLYLKEQGISALLTKEPTIETQAGKRIAEIFANNETIAHRDMQKLFIADRKQHLCNVIEPALQKGIWVVTDRYAFSNFAYGSAFGVDLDWLKKESREFILPDKTIMLQLDPDIAMKRIYARNKKIDAMYEQKEKLYRIEKAYNAIFPAFPNIVAINGNQSIEKVLQDIISAITPLL